MTKHTNLGGRFFLFLLFCYVIHGLLESRNYVNHGQVGIVRNSHDHVIVFNGLCITEGHDGGGMGKKSKDAVNSNEILEILSRSSDVVNRAISQ